MVEIKGIFRPFSWFEITHTGHISATGISTRTQIARFIILRYHLPQAQHKHIKLSINSHMAVELSIDLKVWIFVRGIPCIATGRLELMIESLFYL